LNSWNTFLEGYSTIGNCVNQLRWPSRPCLAVEAWHRKYLGLLKPTRANQKCRTVSGGATSKGFTASPIKLQWPASATVSISCWLMSNT